jgi:hypothetical protein
MRCCTQGGTGNFIFNRLTHTETHLSSELEELHQSPRADLATHLKRQFINMYTEMDPTM